MGDEERTDPDSVTEVGSDALVSLGEDRLLVAQATAAERVADRIRARVIEGQFKPGMRLPEKEIGERLKVSRNTVREALSQLIVERVCVRVPNSGVSVSTPDAQDLRDLYRARRAIEPGAVRFGDECTRAAVAAVRAAVDEGRTAANAGRWHDVSSANSHFHRALVALAGSPRLDHHMALLLAEMRLVFHRMENELRTFHEPYLWRNDVIASRLEAGDRAAAAEEIVAYLDAAEKQLLRTYEKFE